MLVELERIDDECDQKGITFVKIDNADEAKEYGIEDLPTIIYFEDGVPTLYEGKYFASSLDHRGFMAVSILGDLLNEEEVLEWLFHQLQNDEIEEVTDEMLDKLIDQEKNLAVLFCK